MDGIRLYGDGIGRARDTHRTIDAVSRAVALRVS